MGIGAWKARMTDGFRATGSCFVVVCGLGNEGMKMQDFKTILICLFCRLESVAWKCEGWSSRRE